MIIHEVLFGLKCDRCEQLYDCGEHIFWMDGKAAHESALEDGWVDVNGKHYCTTCHEIGDDEKVTVYEEYPKHLKILNKYFTEIIQILGSEVDETNDDLTIKYRLFKRDKLEEHEITFVKGLLGNLFLSIECKPDQYGHFIYCHVKFLKQS